MKLLMFAASAALLACALPAYATTPGNNGGGNGGCGVGQQTNGCGGQGGQGGQGGDASAAAGAVAGAAAVAGVVNDSFNTTVKVDHSVKVDDHSIKNTATGGAGGSASATGLNLQGQQQGQQQSTSSSASSDQTQAQALTDSSVHTQSTQVGSASSANGNGAGQTTTFTQNYEATKRSAASAYAAPLQIGSLVCGISKASLALQLPGAGASGQVGQIDQGCERRSVADVFARMGMTYEACVIMVRDPIAQAAGFTAATCVHPAPAVVFYEREPAAPAKPAATMAPIPNPVVVQDGERG